MIVLFKFSHESLLKTAEKKKMSPGEISRKTKEIDPNSKGVSRTSVLNTLQGKSVPSADTFAMICAALEVSPKSRCHWVEIKIQ